MVLTKVVPPLRYAEDGRTLTEDFLRSVGEAMAVAGRVEDAPARFLAERENVPERTIHRWMYVARKRGYAKAGKRGRPQLVRSADDER